MAGPHVGFARTGFPRVDRRVVRVNTSRGCAECHGANGGGREFINDGKSMVVKSPNISTGPGSVVVNYSVVDWVRTIRHGVKPNGQPVFIMPSEDYNRLTDADVGALIAY